MLLSLLFAHPLALAFRWIELAAMGLAVLLVTATIRDGRSKRWEGAALVAAYVATAVGFYVAGNR